MVREVIDLTNEPEFEFHQNPFLNDPPATEETEIIEIGHNYVLRNRISYKLNVIKSLIQEMEHDIRLSQFNTEVGR